MSFRDQVDTDWNNIGEGLDSEGKVFSETITYDRASTGAQTSVTAFPEEQVGALDDKQNKLFRIRRANLTHPPERGDIIYQDVTVPDGSTVTDKWWVVDVRIDDIGFYELRCIKAEEYS